MSGGVRELDRRAFLRSGLALASGLTLGVRLSAAQQDPPTPFAPNAFVRTGTDDRATVIAKHCEFGQGTYTGLPTLVADELDADWAQVAVEAAPADASRYANLAWGGAQGTGGSSSIANAFEQMRRAGATARAMLVAAAAAEWQVAAAEITVTRGVVSHAASGRNARFGELAARAATLPVPATVKLKAPEQFIYIGRDLTRTDQAVKLDGRAQYTCDVMRPDMRTALVLHPPRVGAKVGKVDDRAARAIAGVEAVVPVSSGVAVVARAF